MNMKEVEKLIWKNVVVYLQNLDDLDTYFYGALRNGFDIDEQWEWSESIGFPATEAHQNRFDTALQNAMARARRFT